MLLPIYVNLLVDLPIMICAVAIYVHCSLVVWDAFKILNNGLFVVKVRREAAGLSIR